MIVVRGQWGLRRAAIHTFVYRASASYRVKIMSTDPSFFDRLRESQPDQGYALWRGMVGFSNHGLNCALRPRTAQPRSRPEQHQSCYLLLFSMLNLRDFSWLRETGTSLFVKSPLSRFEVTHADVMEFGSKAA